MSLRANKTAPPVRRLAAIWPQREDTGRIGTAARGIAGARPYEVAKPVPSLEAKFARHLLKQRRLRESILGGELFADPVWDMLLDLYAAEMEGISVSVTSLCMASVVPSTTAQRCLKDMLRRGLVVRDADPRDGRRVNMRLTVPTRDSIAETLRALLAADTRFHAIRSDPGA